MLEMETIGRRRSGLFIDAKNVPIDLLFKLYPWEWMMREAFGRYLPGAPTQFVEPPWKAILSNKGILPLLWAMFPGHPNLLPAYFDDDEKAAELGNVLRAQAALLARGRQYRAGASPAIRSTAIQALTAPRGSCARRWRRCRNSTATSGARFLDRRRPALRPVGARGCEPDHQEFVALPAARHRRLGGLHKSLLQLPHPHCPSSRNAPGQTVERP